MLRGSVREDAGRVAHDDAALARRVEVDVVEPDRVVRDDAELGAGGVEIGGVDPDGRRDDDSVRVARGVDELEVGGELLLDLGGHAGRLVDARSRHRAYASSTRGSCEDE